MFKYFKFVTLLLVIFFIFLFSCTKKDSSPQKGVIAYVNNAPILVSDFKKELARREKQDPSFKLTPQSEAEQLDMMIDRQLIIQEAMEKGLAKKEKFVDTIKTFWEQTLIRDFIDYKKEEFKGRIKVTSEDVKKYYDELSRRVTFRFLKSSDKRYIDSLYNKLIKNKEIEPLPWQIIGPVGYDDITEGVLLDAFNMQLGELKKFDDAPYYYIIMLSNIDKVVVGPLESLRPEIEKRVEAIKERQLFEKWLREKRKKSKIKVIGGA